MFIGDMLNKRTAANSEPADATARMASRIICTPEWYSLFDFNALFFLFFDGDSEFFE